VAAVLGVVPLFMARHLPMSDLPEHLAAMATIRHYGDPAWRSQEYFTLAGVFDTQYWLYHATGAALSVPFGSVERANLFMLAIIGLAYPYALRSLLVAMGKDPRLAIFGVPLFWSRSLTVGLLNFVASAPVLLFALALAFRQAQKPTRGRGLAIALLCVVLLYLHLSTFVLFLGQATIIFLLVPTDGTMRGVWRALPQLPRRLAWMCPGLLMALVVARHGSVDDGGHALRFTPTLALVRELPAWMFDSFRSLTDDALGAALLLLAAPLALAAPWRDRTNRVSLLLFGSTLLGYFAMPAGVGSSLALLDVRMAVFVGLFLPLLLRPLGGLRGALPLAGAVLVSMAMSVNCASQIRGFETEEVGHFDDLLQQMPHGKRLLMLDFEPRSRRVHSAIFTYFGSYYRARYGGVASFSFSELPHWPVRYRKEKLPPLGQTWGNACVFRNTLHGNAFDYVLAHGDKDPFVGSPGGPRWTMIGGNRAWKLYARNVNGEESDPLDAPDSPDLGPCAPPLPIMHASN
jgi:hypothetical protein